MTTSNRKILLSEQAKTSCSLQSPSDRAFSKEKNMKRVIPATLALALMSGIAQAQYGGTYNPYTSTAEELERREVTEERKAAAEERKLRVELMEEQKRALRRQSLDMGLTEAVNQQSINRSLLGN